MPLTLFEGDCIILLNINYSTTILYGPYGKFSVSLYILKRILQQM